MLHLYRSFQRKGFSGKSLRRKKLRRNFHKLPEKTNLVFIHGDNTLSTYAALNMLDSRRTTYFGRPTFYSDMEREINFYQKVKDFDPVRQKIAIALGYNKNETLNTNQLKEIDRMLYKYLEQKGVEVNIVSQVEGVEKDVNGMTLVKTTEKDGKHKKHPFSIGTLYHCSMNNFREHNNPMLRNFPITDHFLQRNWNTTVPLSISGTGPSAITMIRECLKSGRDFILTDKEAISSFRAWAEQLKNTGEHDLECDYILSDKFKRHCLGEEYPFLTGSGVIEDMRLAPNDPTIKAWYAALMKYAKQSGMPPEHLILYVDKTNPTEIIKIAEHVNCIGYKPFYLNRDKLEVPGNYYLNTHAMFGNDRDTWYVNERLYGSGRNCNPIVSSKIMSEFMSEEEQILHFGARLVNMTLSPDDDETFVKLCKSVGMQASTEDLKSFFYELGKQINKSRTNANFDTMIDEAAKVVPLSLEDIEKLKKGKNELINKIDRMISKDLDKFLKEELDSPSLKSQTDKLKRLKH